MTKYLDSKGLSYLWQRIKAELATKEGVHEHPYVKNDTVIKLGSSDITGISLVKPEAEGKAASWTIPFATIETVTDGDSTSTLVKQGIVRSGVDTFTVPTDANSTWHKAPIIDGYVYYQNTLADANTVTAAADLTANQIVLGNGSKGIKVAGNTISTAFNTTPTTAPNPENPEEQITIPAAPSTTAVPTESAIANYVKASTFALEERTTGEGGNATTTKYLVLKDQYNAEIASIDATDFLVDGMLDSVAYKTIEQGEGEEKVTVTTNILVFTWNTEAGKETTEVDLGKYIDVYTEKEKSGIKIENHEISVRTTGIPEGKTANVSSGFDANGNVVGYVDLSAYQKSTDLVAFTQADMDAIFDAADELYAAETNGDKTKTKNTPAYPEVDPLAPATPDEEGAE